MIRAGDILNFSWYGRNFDPAPETDVTMILPGFGTESTPNGNGTVHVTGRRRLGGFDGFAIFARDMDMTLNNPCWSKQTAPWKKSA